MQNKWKYLVKSSVAFTIVCVHRKEENKSVKIMQSMHNLNGKKTKSFQT